MDWSFSSIGNVVGGGLVLIFLLWQVVQKVFDSFGWFEKQKAKKKQKQRDELEADVSDIVEKKILPPILQEMKSINQKQSQQLECLIHSSNDLLRMNINKLYYQYLPTKSMPAHDWKLMTLLYTDYHKQGGNTYIDEIYEEMKGWEHLKV